MRWWLLLVYWSMGLGMLTDAREVLRLLLCHGGWLMEGTFSTVLCDDLTDELINGLLFLLKQGVKICWIIELMQVMGSQNLWWCLLRNLMMCGIKNSIFTSIFKTILWLYFNLYSARYVWRRLAVHSTVSYIVY